MVNSKQHLLLDSFFSLHILMEKRKLKEFDTQDTEHEFFLLMVVLVQTHQVRLHETKYNQHLFQFVDEVIGKQHDAHVPSSSASY